MKKTNAKKRKGKKTCSAVIEKKKPQRLINAHYYRITTVMYEMKWQCQAVDKMYFFNFNFERDE